MPLVQVEGRMKDWDDEQRRLKNAELTKAEERLIESIKEQLLENKGLHEHILDKIQFYWGDLYGFDVRGSLTDFQEEFVCQCQVQLFAQILSKMY